MESDNTGSRSRGVICIVCAAFFFALMNLFIRLSGDIPTMEKCFFRNAVAALIAFIMMKRKGDSFKLKEGNLKFLFMRAVLGTVGLICNFYAVDHINISDASALNKLSPFFAIFFSWIILGEKADKFEWLMTAIAFAGAILVVKPGFSADIFPAALGVLGGMAAGAAYTFVRKLGKLGENSLLIILFFSVFSCIAVIPFFICDFQLMRADQLLFLMLTGAAAMGGQFFIVAAYIHAPAKEISVYDYSQVIFAAVLGWLFLEQSPDILSTAGYAVIIAAAVMRWRYGIKEASAKK